MLLLNGFSGAGQFSTQPRRAVCRVQVQVHACRIDCALTPHSISALSHAQFGVQQPKTPFPKELVTSPLVVLADYTLRDCNKVLCL